MPSTILSLDCDDASLVLEDTGSGPLVWRHLGPRVDSGRLGKLADEQFAASFSLDRPAALTTAPAAGMGWFGPPVLQASREDGLLALQFDRASLAANPDRIACELVDPVAGLELRQIISRDGDVFRFSATLRNTGEATLHVAGLVAALLPLPRASELISWRGRHNAELVECREPMPAQQWRREGRRGISGHGGAPGICVLSEGATWHSGLTLAAQLAWSGDAVLAIERLDDGRQVLSAGVRYEPGEIVLAPGEELATSELLLAVSTGGRNGAAQAMHAAVRRSIGWPGGRMKPRPVHLNSWEACYFDHDEARIGELAEAAAVLGVERFVLDDGWFAGRSDDTRALGDWTPDPVKYPRGLKPLAEKVRALGMEFGLWVEPEMVSPDSELYRAHPDWALAAPGRDRPTGRNQLVLDLRRPEVREHLFGSLDRLLREVPISYLKWDHNRDLAPSGGAGQVEGTYALLQRLREAHPRVEIEGCAGGGGRSDAGLARLVHRFWASDNLDAVSRAAIQRGFLAFLPPEMMGAHVGAAPAHATGRSQSLDFRAAMAFGGHFGVELDPRMLSEDDRERLAGWIGFYKEWRDLLHAGRLWQGDGADGLAWQAQGEPGRFLLKAWRTDPPLDSAPAALELPFVGPGAHKVTLLKVAGRIQGGYRNLPPRFIAMRDEGVSLDGTWLAGHGLPMPWLGAESAAIFLVESCP